LKVSGRSEVQLIGETLAISFPAELKGNRLLLPVSLELALDLKMTLYDSLYLAIALSALAESNAGKNAAALDLLIESLKIAARGKMIRLYLDLGSQMRELLKQVTPVAEIAEFVQDILTAFAENNAGQLVTNQRAKGQPGIYTDGLELPFHENLSLRETEVLRLMAEAISLQEIADRLFISYVTAKRHTVNIYSKLGVHSRWEAVSFARKYGIV
jgi:LuxR family transcriptional regulator, maltose regulon positive regulatory protein